MMTLFNKYKNANKIKETVFIGRNAFNKAPADNAVFDEYFEFLCNFAEKLPVLEERMEFAEQAEVILAFYSENANLDETVIAKIASCQRRLQTILEAIQSAQIERRDKNIASVQSENAACLREINSLKDAISKTETQEQFDKVLEKIGEIDAKIDKDKLTDEQAAFYERLTKDHTDIISKKMRDLEHSKNIKYNETAVDSFARAFKQFREDEEKYKNQSQLFSLASTTLFAFDASRLFNETLIYYSHVYSYIFGKLDDDGKLALTRFSIECEGKQG